MLSLLILGLLGCVSTINATNAGNHAKAAKNASDVGDWKTAREQWAKALMNAQLAGASDQQLSVFSYEYGRALGVQCYWDEAEKYLQKAYELDLKTAGPDYMSLTELSRLKYDQKQYDKAVGYYRRAFEAMEKFGAAKKSPIGFADLLGEYANALQETGEETEAKIIRNRANDLRRLNPTGHSVTDRTPYGTQCKK